MHTSTSTKTQEARVANLQLQVERLQEELGADVDADQIVKKHIKLLHQYNEAKDATQILIGRLATLKEITVRQIHEEYDLHDTD